MKRRGWDQPPLSPALTPVALIPALTPVAAPPTVKRRGWDQPPAVYPPAEAVALVSAEGAALRGDAHAASGRARAGRVLLASRIKSEPNRGLCYTVPVPPAPPGEPFRFY